MLLWTQLNVLDCQMGVHLGQASHQTTPQNIAIVFALARSAALRGDPAGDYAIGQVYHFGGGGVKINREEAMTSYMACSKAGLDVCDRRLGGIHTDGELGYTKDLKPAVNSGAAERAP